MNPKDKSEPSFQEPEQISEKAKKLISEAAGAVAKSFEAHDKMCVAYYKKIAAEIGYKHPEEAAGEMAGEIPSCFDDSEMEQRISNYVIKQVLEWDKEELTEHLKKIQEQLDALK